MADSGHDNDRLLTSREVAEKFRVDPKTVTRWATRGKLTDIRTGGGHHRFWESEIRAMLRGGETPHSPASADGEDRG